MGRSDFFENGFIMLTIRRAVSPDGISFSFDSRANGYGRGEGAGCLVLRSTNDAIRARNTIRANVRNTGINHCGRSQGITVPKQEAQIELIHGVYAAANLDPTETAFVECHGTGTSKGDPIEANSIASAFGSSSLDMNDPLYIGSVKSNFGESDTVPPPLLISLLTLPRTFRRWKWHLVRVESHRDVGKRHDIAER